MKKFATILIVSLLLAGCGGYRSLGRIRSSETLRVLVRENPDNPYAYYDGGSAYGYEIDLIEEFAMALEVMPEYASVSAEGMEAAIASGEADMAVGMLALASPENYAEGYTLPYYREKLVFVCPVGAMLSAAEDLNGKSIGLVETQGGESLGELGNLSDDVTFVIIQDAEDAARQLSQGRVDAVMCLYNGAADILAGNSGLKCVELGGLPPVSFCAYVNRQNQGLMEAYNEFVTRRQLEESGEDVSEFYDEPEEEPEEEM
jgi:polar amino acid transport system substrate-binding protein